ncbi:endonuclease/exonuclease/phosphatase family protein [Mariniluteicoccus endophyticus]
MTRRILTILFAVLAVLAAIPSTATLTLGLLPRLQGRSTLLAQVSAFLHYGLLGWLVTFLLALAALTAARHRSMMLLVVPALAGLVVQTSWVAPYYVNDSAVSDTLLGVTVVNVEFGHMGGPELVKALKGNDVVIVLEATPETLAALTKAGMDRDYPHRAGRGAPGVRGTVVYSRLPVKDLGMGPTLLESRLVSVETPSGPILVAGVHPVPPIRSAGEWAVDAAALHGWLAPHLDKNLVIAGDFNAIDRHATMQPYWKAGYRSSADLAAGGFQRTWPRDGMSFVRFPLVGIDHVLLSPHLTAQRHQLVRVSDTDHLGVRTVVGRYRKA